MAAHEGLGRRMWKGRAGYAFLALPYLAFLTLVLIPLAAAIAIAFFETDFVTFKFVGLGNFREYFTNTDYTRVLLQTVRYVLVIVPASVSISLLLAFLIRPLTCGLQSFFRGAFYLPAVVGGIVITVVWLWIFNPTYGLLNYLLGLGGFKSVQWLATGRTAWISVSIVVFSYTLGTQLILFLAGLANISEELHDAAKVDGANGFQIATRVDVPLLRPVLAFVVAIQIIGVFQLWETIYVLTFGGPRGASASVVFQIYQTAFQFSRYGLGSAMGIVLMVIIVAVTLIQRRFWGEDSLL
jgi:multiple sugar transport system permease protein